MYKRLAVSGIGLALLASPLFASALSVDVQVKIDALLAQIKSLQAQIAKLKGETSTRTDCVVLNNTLTLGSKDTSAGDDVTRLQNYLSAKGYFTGEATGYYGFITAQAVGKMQIALGLLSSESDLAYGFAGPKTRAAISCRVMPTDPVTWPQHCPVASIAPCPTGQHREPYGATKYDLRNCPVTPTKCVAGPDPTFSASPTSGKAPLAVQFRIQSTEATYTLKYGDGMSTQVKIPRFEWVDGSTSDADAASHPISGMEHHTYTSAGTYTATLIGSCGNAESCAATTWSFGSATITVN